MDQDGLLYDVTPVIERSELSNPFAVSSGSALVTVSDDGHNLAVDQRISFPGISSAANVAISGVYAVSLR